jgi:hypothetical protein
MTLPGLGNSGSLDFKGIYALFCSRDPFLAFLESLHRS